MRASLDCGAFGGSLSFTAERDLSPLSRGRAGFRVRLVLPRGDKSSSAPAVRESSVAACGQGLKLAWEVWEFFPFEEERRL